jgi:N utilization substance protein A
MSKELVLLIDQISREKGVPKDVLMDAISSALLSAAKKKHGGKENMIMNFDEGDYQFKLFEVKTVMEEGDIEDPVSQVTPEEGKELDPESGVGDEILIPVPFEGFGRIAAQTAKQVIFQRVREAERDVIFNEFKDKVGQIISGTVMRKEKGRYFINVGKTDAELAIRDALPGESLKRGDQVKALIEEIRNTSKGPVIVITRVKPDFVAALFEQEVPEIAEGLVKIKDVVREPGERTKIAVYSTTQSVDPVGACVGMKGTRVQSIVRELRGERIDIIPWIDDLRMLIARALSPASIERVGIVEEEKTAMVVVNDENLSIAIGKKGQNVRLAMKLTHWDIDIISETEYSKIKMDEADQAFDDSVKTPVETDDSESETAEDTAPESEATESEATESEATESEATEPEATEPETTEPEATEPEATEE